MSKIAAIALDGPFEVDVDVAEWVSIFIMDDFEEGSPVAVYSTHAAGIRDCQRIAAQRRIEFVDDSTPL